MFKAFVMGSRAYVGVVLMYIALYSNYTCLLRQQQWGARVTSELRWPYLRFCRDSL